jgi:hypothetical protein
MYGDCAFCGEHKTLKESHVIPAFVYRWLRTRSGTGHIRQTVNPNKRIQDGLKLHWLCGDCEAEFGRHETEFAKKVFYPWQNGDNRISYDDWLLKFCVSVSWRVLKFCRDRNADANYTAEQDNLMNQAEQRWRDFLQGKAPHPANFEQHLLIFGNVFSTTISDLPNNFNRFMTGAITLDIVGSDQSLMTYAKMGRFQLFGIIQKGPNKWVGTKVHVKQGVLKPDKFTLPIGMLDLFREKAKMVSSSMSEMSSIQKEKIEKHVRDNLEEFLKSEQFSSIEADIAMFGRASVLKEDD